ncbi:hypothetical protein ACGFIK_18000 [Micromonospora sp. NPDC048871]|uniref:hypothetical protein n=1 Tax=unclassified Micromonospora TaxID=2617518 RepID=UPI002E14FB3B|nr:hypothetical protein OIE53_24580 [Micromonospora sp. NBC_01739]
MTVPAPRVRRRPRTRGRLLPLLLTVALLLPVALLTGQAHRLLDADREVAERERLGVTYLRTLGPLTVALVDAQSAAVARRPTTRLALDQAVEQVAAVDAEIGGELRTGERWAGLRAKLEALPERPLSDPEAAFSAYREVTDLLLALHTKVRETSGLVQDPGADSYFLQDGVGEEMPEALVAAGRLTDLVALVQRRPDSERLRSLSELAAYRVAALQPANDLVNNLRAVMDSSESADLGGHVLTPFDAYQRGVEAMALTSQPDRTGAIDLVRLTGARLEAHEAAKQLQPVLLDEVDRLLVERIDELNRDDLLVLGAGGVAVLLLVALAVTGWSARRKDDPVALDPAGGAPTGVDPTVPTTTRWEQMPAQRSPVAVGNSPDPDRWRPFDAAR